MAYRVLELTLQSARDLKNVNLFTRMDVYAVASISGDPMTRQCTPTDTFGGRHPSWNATVRFSVPPSAEKAGSGWLHVLLRSERTLGDRDVGEVVVPLAELLAGAEGPGQQPPRLASYQVHTVHRGDPRGVLNVSYRLGPVVAPVQEPAMGYPPPEKPQNPQHPQYHHPHGGYGPPHPFNPQNRAGQQPPFQPQNPPPYRYHDPHGAYASPQQQPMKPQNPTPPSPQPVKPQNRHEGALSPANGEGNGHGSTIYMGPQTHITFEAKTVPPKPSYTPTQHSTYPVKTDHHSWPKSFPQHRDNATRAPTPVKTDHSWPKPLPQNQDTPSWPNASPKKPDRPTRSQQDTRIAELAQAQSKIGSIQNAARPQALKDQDNTTKVSNISSGRTPSATYTQGGEHGSVHAGKAESRPKEAYASGQTNSMPKAILRQERMPSMPTATAR